MPIITPERAGEIRAKTCEKYGAVWLHHYHEAIEEAILQEIALREEQKAKEASGNPAVWWLPADDSEGGLP